MSKYEDMAKRALDEQASVKAARDEAAQQMRNRAEERRRADQAILDEYVVPVLREAIKGFTKAGIEARTLDVTSRPIPSFAPSPYVGIEVGHNRTGITGDRLVTMVVWADDEKVHVTTNSGNGPEKTWKTDAAGAAIALEGALGDSLDRWTERDYPRRR